MPYHSELIDDGTGVLRVGMGVLTGQELIDAARAVPSAIPGLKNITHSLVDFTSVEVFDVSTDSIHELSKLMGKNGEMMGPMRVAIAAPTPLSFGMSRMYAALASKPGWEVQTFRTLEEAKGWLYAKVEQDA